MRVLFRSVEVAAPMQAWMLVARDLVHDQARLGDADVDQRLHFEAVAVEAHVGQTPSPEGVVSVAEVGVVRAVQRVDKRVQDVVADASSAGYVGAGPTLREARPLDEIGSVAECSDEPRYLRRVRRAVGIQRHDHLTRADRKPVCQGIALATTGLPDDSNLWTQ